MLQNPAIARGKATLILAASLGAVLGIAFAVGRTTAGTPEALKPEQSSLLMMRGHDMWGPPPQQLGEKSSEQHLCWSFGQSSDYAACD
jgi:hypothetical protein